MKKIFLIIGLLFLITASFLYFNYRDKITPQVTINNHIFNSEIAKTDKEREIGLAKYSNIPQNFGMLFLFEKPGAYSFWMKNMKFSIDIIFIRNNTIIKIFNDVPAPKSNDKKLPIYTSAQFSDTILEINAGLSKKYKFKNGDTVKIKL